MITLKFWELLLVIIGCIGVGVVATSFFYFIKVLCEDIEDEIEEDLF
jgi:hypothetical protein